MKPETKQELIDLIHESLVRELKFERKNKETGLIEQKIEVGDALNFLLEAMYLNVGNVQGANKAACEARNRSIEALEGVGKLRGEVAKLREDLYKLHNGIGKMISVVGQVCDALHNERAINAVYRGQINDEHSKLDG
ncbi:MAG: hypothetical protein WC233_10200 [Sphaerochaeta sp.]|jgi:hypothetical protein